ncbi:MAG TPA: CDP-alcohol phosphatidyltransferase family protein [Cytophagales bacterium]|nr:CDP-alcohol phosphatidyltransferase family protein [Cytophagales bacterium]
MKRSIPHIFTLLNLTCGCIGLVLVLSSPEYLKYGAFLIVIACIFDFFDGFAARMLNVRSELGKQLDSLADMVTFGALPSMMVFELLKFTYDVQGIEWLNCKHLLPDYQAHIVCSINQMIPYFPAFLIAIFSAIRLAVFNIDTKQVDGFLGLPTPANALFVGSLVLMISNEGKDFEFNEIINYNFLYSYILAACMLMVSRLPMISFKFKNLSWEMNIWRYVLLIGCTAIIVLAYAKGVIYFGLCLCIIYYIVLSIISAFFKKA